MDTRINHVATMGRYKIYQSEKGRLLQRSFFLLVLLIAISVNSFGQTAGDYQTRATGNWNANTTWQKYNGTTWANCTASDYPGASAGAGNVTIRTGNNVTLNVNVTIGGLEVNANLTATTNRTLTVTGNFNLTSGTVNLSNQNNRSTTVNLEGNFTMSGGTLTEGANQFVAFVFNGGTTQTFTKTGGTISNTINFTVNSGTNLDMGTSILNGSSGTFTLSPGATLTTANVDGIYYSGAVGSIQTTTRTINTGSNLIYNGTSAQVIGSFNLSSTINNLTINNPSGVTLSNSTTVNGTLALTSGVLTLGDYSLTLTSTSTNAIQGTYSGTNMIETSGSGYLIRPAGTTTLPIDFPVGSDGYYSPVSISAISGGTTGDIRIRTEADATLGSNYLPRTWEAITSDFGKTLTVTFNYDAAETSITPENVWVKPSSGSWQTPTGTASFGTNSFTIATTTDITSTSTYWTAGLVPDTYFSYQTGSWNNPSTWTSDPGGTTQVGTTVPGDGDVVVILSGRTVTLPADIATASLEVNINSGGTLNMSTYSFTSGLSALNGSGTLKLASTNFPTTVTNTFVNAGGGTVEYNNTSNFTLPAAQATYNNLTVNTSVGVVCTQLSNLTLNGNLLVKQGTYRINDNTSTTKLNLTIEGNVTVNSGAYITVGQGSTNTTTSPTSLSGGTAPFLNYYEQFHRVIINGNFTNNGTVKFTNLTAPIYNAFPPLGSGVTSGAASVYFQGTSNATMLCNGTTDFYNIILDKGTDQTYSLTIQPSAYSNFRIFGANNAATTGTVANPDIMKALWIRDGSLVLKGLCIIPSLTEGTIAGSEYYIPLNGALVLSGIDVAVLSTADDNGEANVAYSVSGSTGINTTGANYQGLVVYGKLKVNTGYLSTRESPGLLYSSVASGQFEINGGTIDAKQFRTYDGTTSGAEYRQTNGTFILRGRFVRPVAYSSIADLKSTSGALSARAVNGTDKTYGTFNLNFAENIFSMSGGTIRVYDASGNFPGANPQYAIDVVSSLANTSVTGGTFEIMPLAGTVLADASSLLIWSEEAVYGNVTVNVGTGCSTTVGLRKRDLTILKNLTVTAGEFWVNNLNLTLGGNLTVSTNGLYNSTATTTFNGTQQQLFTIDGSINNGATGLTNLVNNNTVDTLEIAGTQPSLTVQGTFDLNGGVFDDGGKTIYIAGNVTNSGVHVGTGKIQLNGTATQTIGGDGTGIFENLELNNTNAATAPVSLTVNTVINGVLTFSQNKLFNIGANNLHMTSSSSIVNVGTSRFIQTNGESGDGGLTFDYSSESAILFPVGAPSTRHTSANYTPATIGFTSAPTTLGSITVIPVGYEHPATTIDGQSLTYFWRVKSSGFTGIASNSITHTFQYSSNDVVGTVSNYIPALYDRTTYTWVNGTNSNPPINTATSTFTDWTTPGDSRNYLDADYTAGDNAFGALKVYYSLASGLWSSNSTWTFNSSHTGSPAGSVPGSNDIVVIGNNHVISLYNDTNYPLNTASVSCASLQIDSGSTLDIGNNSSSIFSMVVNSPLGNGTFRLTTTKARTWINSDISTFIFPAGDFTDFEVNRGTEEFYTTTNDGGSLYILPQKASFGNMVLSPLGDASAGDNMVLPNVPSVIIYGDLTVKGTSRYSAIGISWNTNDSYYNYSTLYNTVEKTLQVKGDLNINGGSFTFYDDDYPQHLVVDGDVKVAATNGANIIVWDRSYGYIPYHNGPTVVNTFIIGGSLNNNGVNNGNFDGVRLTVNNNNHYVDVTFQGSSNESFTGNGNTYLHNLTINKGNSQETTLICDIGGTLTTPTDAWLTLQNGTFKYMRTDPTTNFTISTNSPFTIPSTAGLYIDYSNGNNTNIVISNTTSKDESDLFLEGKLTIIEGNVLIGSGTSSRNNDIEYAGGGFSEINIQGGYLRVNGQIRRNPSMAGGILKYSQSGGVVDILGINATTTNAKFEVCNATSTFNMSGGELNITRGGGGSTYGDCYIRPGSSTVTGGTINFAHNLSGNPQTYRLDANVPLYNVTISGRTTATAANAEVDLMVNPLVLKGTLLLSNGNSILNANNINVTVKGDFTNNGTTSSYIYGTNTTTFSGSTQQLNGTSATNFYSLTVSPVASLTLNNGNNVIVNNDLTISAGTLVCGNYAVNLKGDLTNDATYTDSQYGVILNSTTAQQTIYGTGTYGRLELDNSNGAVTGSNITLNKNLALTNGIFGIGDYKLSLGQNSSIEGTGFGASKMITTNGVFSDQGVSKVFGIISGPSVNFTYPLGVSGKYTPIDVTVDANTNTGTIRINCVNDRHPAVIDPNNVLQYYWAVESYGISGFNGTIVFNYLDGDVMGTEADYSAARIVDNAWGFPGTVDDVGNTLTYNFTGVNDLGDEYTAGNGAAFPPDIPVFTSVKNGNWNDHTTWVQTSGTSYTLTGGPNGFIVIVNDTVTLNENYCHAYRTTINGEIRKEEPFFGHNLGTVDGNGTLYLENETIPAGKYDTFFSCSNGSTLEYGGTSDYELIASLYNELATLKFSGTGTRTLPDKDLTICNLLEIDGPTVDNSLHNRKLIINGEMILTSGAFNSGSGSTATVSFAGTSLQHIENFNGANALNNIEINNSQGLTLDSPIEVTGNLLLTNGLINTNATNILYISNAAVDCVIPDGGSSSSYVNGPLKKYLPADIDAFLFPIGNSSRVGNKLSLIYTEPITLDWTVEYINPSSLNTYSSPLTAINDQEYWVVGSSAGTSSGAIVNIAWDPSSSLTPLMTQNGISDMRVSEYNGSNWTELATTITSGSDNYNGSAETSSRVSIGSGSTKNYTLACVNVPKPRIRLAPTGPICGGAGIPIELSSSYSITGTYTVNYTENGNSLTIHPASFPATLPTDINGGTYVLTSFTYESGAKTGAVDATSVTTYAIPTTADIGNDSGLDDDNISDCGGTTVANLPGNNPIVGTGLWTVVSGSGGSFIDPTVYNTQFSGTNGSTYTLRWTISNGTCTSSDDMTVSFPLLPVQPLEFTVSKTPVCQGESDVIYTVPYDPSVTYTWSYTVGTGAIINGTTNSVTVDFSTTATSGTLSVTATNGCGTSSPRSISITVNQSPIATIALVGSGNVCDGDSPQMTITFSGGTSPYSFSITDGTSTENFTNKTSPYTYTPATSPIWTGPGTSNTYTYSIPTVTSANGCSSVGANTVDVAVYKVPETGPEYHVPNDYGL